MTSLRLLLSYVTLMAACLVTSSKAQQNPESYATGLSSNGGWDTLGGLYALLAQHDALNGHALARKSVRSPSRRLRFGRRSDPDVPPLPPMEELDELLRLREPRDPVRLRFGRRSFEEPMPHIFPNEGQDREQRTPSIRLRFGRSSDNNMFLMPLPQEVPKDKPNSDEADSNIQY